jgi:hypothetical protein
LFLFAFLHPEIIFELSVMLYPWPIGDPDFVLDDALDIAMRYLSQTGHGDDYTHVERRAANAILAYWRNGVRNPIYLANKGIVAVERASEPLGNIYDLYPRVG